jgi:hypothetical protein
LAAKIRIRPAPEKFIKFIKFITFTTFVVFDQYIQMLNTVARKMGHAEERSISATRANVPEPRDAATCSSPAGSA